MSVINKMLRDLDQRQGAHPRQPVPVPSLQQDTHSVPVHGSAPSPDARTRRGAGVVAALVLGGGMTAAAWWFWPTEVAPAPTLARSEPLPVAAVLPTVPASAPASVAVVSEPASAPVPAASAVTAEPVAEPVTAPVLLAAPRSVPDSRTPPPVMSLRMEPMLPTRKALEAVLSGGATPVGKAAASAPAEATAPAQRQQQASTDALAQAQSLWNSGNHAQALDLVQQSVDAVERVVKAGSSAVGNPVLLSLVREWVRMQMAQSRFAAVWELLVRLEPVLGPAPDLWALRGNTAQRLGYHQDSVNAYRFALQSNPGEQRWLLGSAVSLAALGQTSQAAEMAERARSVGEISREVQAYLRQLGVPLKDK